MRLASLLSFASSSSVFLSPRHEVEAGFWDVTVSKGTSAEGMVWHDVFSVYSGAPDATVHCSYVRGSQAGAVGETECDGVGSAGFRYEWNAEAGVQSEFCCFTLPSVPSVTILGIDSRGSGKIC
jgi:hypothetical protein